MIHLRIVVPSDRSRQALDVLEEADAVCNVIFLEDVARKPAGDVILCDVAREEASVLIADLKDLEIHKVGSITLEDIDSQISASADRAVRAARGAPSDAVVWEEVEARTSENIELSASYLAFFVLACLIASVGIIFDTPILIVGAMVVGPEFGPIAALCVAAVQKRRDVARRSLRALAVGFPVGITMAYLFTLGSKELGLISAGFSASDHPLTSFISHPDEFSLIVAMLAGTAGMLSLTSTKSGALIGVLISVTTIPAAANIGVAAAYQDWSEWRGAMAQLAANMTGIFLAGITTLYIQRILYIRRRHEHRHEQPVGRVGAHPLPGRR